MDFRDYLRSNAQRVEKELDQILDQFLAETKKISPKILPLAQEFTKACQGGKRIRAVLVKLGFELMGKKEEEIYKLGAGLEILHTAILIHDDIVDKSLTRRGQQTVYKAVGVDKALALGDVGFFLALKIISETKFSESKKNKALKLLSQTMFSTAIGQVMDIQKDYPLKTARLKTALYTISGPLRLGAALAGASIEQLEKLDQFGTNLGIAYQVKDDLLDGEVGNHAKKQALEYTLKAKKLIPFLTQDAKIEQLLEDMCQYLLERKK